MASNTTYGDWMRPIRGGIRNISRPLTMIGFGVLAVTLMLSMANVVAALVFGVVGLGIVMVLAVRDRQHRNVLDRTVERRAHWLPCVPVCLVSFRPAVIRRAWFLSVAGDPAQGLACGGE